MNTNIVRESANILQFPVRNAQKLKEMRERAQPRPVIYESGCGAWYHEEAIREEDTTRRQ